MAGNRSGSRHIYNSPNFAKVQLLHAIAHGSGAVGNWAVRAVPQGLEESKTEPDQLTAAEERKLRCTM